MTDSANAGDALVGVSVVQVPSKSFVMANEVSQDAATGGRLARRVSCVT